MTVPLFGAPQEEVTSDDYLTPSWVFDALGLRFDVDVAGSPLGGFVPADREFTMADDGLSQQWVGRVWMNPPFSGITPWADRFVEHGWGVALLPMSKSKWFNLVWDRVDGVAVLPPSLKFVGGAVFQGSVLVAFGSECVEAIGRVGHVR